MKLLPSRQAWLVAHKGSNEERRDIDAIPQFVRKQGDIASILSAKQAFDSIVSRIDDIEVG